MTQVYGVKPAGKLPPGMKVEKVLTYHEAHQLLSRIRDGELEYRSLRRGEIESDAKGRRVGPAMTVVAQLDDCRAVVLWMVGEFVRGTNTILAAEIWALKQTSRANGENKNG